MALVKSTDIAFEFPVHTVTAKRQRSTCHKLDDLLRGVPKQIEEGYYKNMEITDASGRRWIVRSFRTIGRIERWNLFHILFLHTPDWRLEYNLEEVPLSSRDRRSSAKGGARSSARHAKPSGRDELERAADGRLDQMADAPPDGGGTVSDSPSTSSGCAVPMVKASDTNFDFPLVGFGAKHGLLCYSDLNSLTNASWVYVREETLIGIELVDNSLRRWIVRSVDPKTPPRVKRWWHFGPDTSAVEFDLGLEELEPTTLELLKRRLLKAWELEDSDDEKAVRRAPTLAAMFEAAYEQGTGLL